MNKDVAISVKNVSKTFRIPHEKVSSLRGAFTQAFHGKTTYEEFKALDDVSFEVKKGEFFGIIGRNGSGKSTLLKVLAGIYQADKGTVHINGLISPFLELGIGFNPELSGRDNVYLNATVLGMTQKQIDEKFDDIVKFSELERFIDQKLKNYSSGMQVRLAFSVSIHANRDILLMDEVLAVGDSNFQSKCLEEFAKYRDMGRTVIIVTHDISVVQRYCDRAMLLRDGKVKMIGKAEEVANEYIQENMSDEERRMKADKEVNKDNEVGLRKEEEGDDRGTKEIKIDFVKIFEKNNENEKYVFLSGSSVVFKIGLSFGENVDLNELIFGLGIHLQENNQYCFSLNSFVDKITISPKEIERGFVDIEIPNLILNEGRYIINAIVSRKKLNFNKPIHFMGGINSFIVKNKEYSEGLFNLEHYWK